LRFVSVAREFILLILFHLSILPRSLIFPYYRTMSDSATTSSYVTNATHPLKIAVVGAGAIGGYYGTCLALAGHDVRFLLRSDLEVVRRNGIRITTPHESFSVAVNAFASTAEIGPCDLVVIALKTTANGRFADLLPPLDNGTTNFLTLQNGMGNAEALATIFGKERVTAGLCFVCINRIASGIIENYQLGQIRFAEAVGAATERTRALAKLFAVSGSDCKTVDSLDKALWLKLCWNIPFNGIAVAAGGITTDQIAASPPLCAFALALMRELQEAAAKYGVAISERHIEAQLASIATMGAYKPSSLVDHLAGRPLEIDAIWGEPLRRGQAHGLPMGNLAALHNLLRHLSAKV
jgi:2-dehydropantoate 2-reductase